MSVPSYDVVEKDIATLASDMSTGRVTSEDLVRVYLSRIDALDRNGPTLCSVIAVNPDALADARASDAERKAKGARGPLHGIPLLIKDNIETADAMATTAGSLALAGNITYRDAPIVARLRQAGAIILGKANLSEWANSRSLRSMSGWSGIGGLTKNPYVLDRSASGSSSGSGSAIAASLAAAALGSETDGSIVGPSSLNGVVGLKPTVGLVSRTHIIPISHSQDTAGPMTRTVADAALLLATIAGSDPADAVTAEADSRKSDYIAALSAEALKGKRLGVLTPPNPLGLRTETDLVFDKAVAALKSTGADIIEIKDFAAPSPDMRLRELTVMTFELKHGLNAYFSSLPPGAKIKTLADVIAFNNATPREMLLFGQDWFEKAQATSDLSDPVYIEARDTLRRYSRDTLDRLFAEHRVEALVQCTAGPSFRFDVVKRDNVGTISSALPATAGMPHISVPMGYVECLPVGLSFIGPDWSEARLLAFAYAFEQALPARKPPQFLPTLETTPRAANAFARSE